MGHGRASHRIWPSQYGAGESMIHGLRPYLPSCIPAFNKYILNTYYKQTSVFGRENKPTNKIKSCPCGA